jgi:hypothetical protein
MVFKAMKWLMLVLLFVNAATAESEGDLDSNTIATVNGISVSKDEFVYVMNREKSSVAGDFITKYKAKYGSGFWEKEYGETKETPFEKLKETTLSTLERTRHMQFLALEYGIIEKIKGFDTLQGELKKVNAERAKIKSENGILYGPVQFTFDVYYNMKNTELEYKLKKDLVELEKSWFSDKDAQSHYNKTKESLFNRGHQLGYYEIRVPAKLLDLESTKKIRAILLSRSEIEKDAFADLPSPVAKGISISKRQRHTNESTQDDHLNKIMLILGDMDVGEASGRTLDAETAVFYKLIEKKHLGYISFDDARYGILRDMYEERINSLLENSSRHVKTKINRKLYDSLTAPQ